MFEACPKKDDSICPLAHYESKSGENFGPLLCGKETGENRVSLMTKCPKKGRKKKIGKFTED